MNAVHFQNSDMEILLIYVILRNSYDHHSHYEHVSSNRSNQIIHNYLNCSFDLQMHSLVSDESSVNRFRFQIKSQYNLKILIIVCSIWSLLKRFHCNWQHTYSISTISSDPFFHWVDVVWNAKFREYTHQTEDERRETWNVEKENPSIRYRIAIMHLGKNGFRHQKIIIADTGRQIRSESKNKQGKYILNRRRRSFSGCFFFFVFLLSHSIFDVMYKFISFSTQHPFFACTRVHCTFGWNFRSLVDFYASQQKKKKNRRENKFESRNTRSSLAERTLSFADAWIHAVHELFRQPYITTTHSHRTNKRALSSAFPFQCLIFQSFHFNMLWSSNVDATAAAVPASVTVYYYILLTSHINFLLFSAAIQCPWY